MARLFDTGIFSVNATNGSVGVGYKLYFYTTGTSTPKNTYPTRADAEAGTNANANPVVAASDGRFAPIWLASGDYKVVLKDFDDVTLETKDPAEDNFEGQLASTASGKGAGLLGFSHSATYAAGTVGQKLKQDPINIMDAPYSAAGDGTTEDGTVIKTAFATGRDIYIPQDKTFLINGVTLLPVAGQRIYGGGRLKKTTYSTDIALSVAVGQQDGPRFIKIESIDNVTIDGIEFEYTGTVSPRVYALTIEDASNTSVRNCRFLGTVTPCFIWKDSINTTYEGNYSEGGNFGLATGGDADGNTNGPVINTTIRGNYITGAISEGIDINWDTQGCLIDGNSLIDNNTTAGEDDIDIGGGVCRDIVIINNYIDSGGNSTNGIIVKLDTKNVKIAHNIIKGGLDSAASIGVYVTGENSNPSCSNVEIIGNTITEFTRPVLVYNGASAVTVSENDISLLRTQANARGIQVSGTSGTSGTVVNNVNITNNILNGNDTATGEGIYIDDLYNFTITDNHINGFALDGITIETPATNGVIKGNRITTCEDGIVTLGTNITIMNNHLYENDKHGLNIQGDRTNAVGNIIFNNSNSSTAGYDGIVLTAGADFCVITNNNVFDSQGTKTQRYGLNVTGACDRCIINDNIFYANATAATNGTGSLTNSLLGTAGNITA